MAAPNGLIVGWPLATAIPTGWTRFTALDNRVPKPATTGLGGTGGSDTHTHPVSSSHDHQDDHTHTGGNTGGGSGGGPGVTLASATIAALSGHVHGSTAGTTAPLLSSAVTPTVVAGANNIGTYTVRWIKSDGTTEIPIGAVAWSNTQSMPTGWQAHAGSTNRYFRGAVAAANGGAAVAPALHTHTAGHQHNHATTSHSHPVSAQVAPGGAQAQAGAGVTVEVAHFHPMSGNTSAVAHNAAASGSTAANSTGVTIDLDHLKLMHVEAISEVAPPGSLVALFESATPPSGWVTCDGGNGSPALVNSGRWVKGAGIASEVGTTGGGSSHAHSHGHTHTANNSLTPQHTGGTLSVTANSAGTVSVVSGATASSPGSHTHSAPTTFSGGLNQLQSRTYSFDSQSFEPPYVAINFVMKAANITVLGNQPSASGRLLKTKTVVGAQPAPSGLLTWEWASRHGFVAGNQPSATATAAGVTGKYVSLAGVQGQPSGRLAIHASSVRRGGSQPGASGRVFATLAPRAVAALPAGTSQRSAPRRGFSSGERPGQL